MAVNHLRVGAECDVEKWEVRKKAVADRMQARLADSKEIKSLSSRCLYLFVLDFDKNL